MKRMFIVLVLSLSAAIAQTPKPVTPAPPQLAEAESLKLENLQLKSELLQQQMLGLQQQYKAVINAINAEHPGFTFDPQKHEFVPIPSPKK